MQKVPVAISNFTKGELSPRMEGRSDSPAFFEGVTTMENFIVLPQGGAERRPGTKYFAEVETTSQKSRLIPFVENEDDRYVLELYDGGIRVIKNDGGTRSFLTTVHTLTLDVAPATDWEQGAQIVGGTSGTTAYVVKKTSGTSWVITEPSGSWTDGEVLTATGIMGGNPSADQGAGYPTSAATTVTTPVYAYRSTSFYTEAQLFAVKYVQIGQQMIFTHPSHEPKILTRMDDTGWLFAEMDNTVPTWIPSDEMRGKLWTAITDWLPKVTSRRKVQQTIKYEAGTIVKHGSSYYRAIQDVTGADSGASPSGTYWEAISSTVDDNPFDTSGDYPTACAYFQDRVLLAGTTNKPDTIWGSGIGEYEDYVLAPTDKDPWSFQLLSDRSDKIQWLVAKDAIIIGTTGSEWLIGGGQNGITPSSVFAKRMTTFGSSSVQAQLINENVVFVQKGGRKIREYYYANDLQAMRAADLTFYSDHITESGVVQLAWQSDPDPILWAVRNDGQLIGLTYDKANGIQGWHRHVTDGEFESIAIIPAGDEDEIWVTVKRTIDGTDTRFIEYFEARAKSDQRDYFHVDCGVTQDRGATFSLTAATAADPVAVTAASHGLSTNDHVRITGVTGMTELEGRVFQVTFSDANTFTLNDEDGTGRTAATAGTCEQVEPDISGLDHLDGETVDVQVDGGPHTQKTVASGSIDLSSGSYGNAIHAGLPYESEIVSMNLMSALTDAEKGTASKVRVRFISTLGGKLGVDEDEMQSVTGYTADAGEAPALFTGEKEEFVQGRFDDDIRVRIQQTVPCPMTVAVILPGLRITGGGR